MSQQGILADNTTAGGDIETLTGDTGGAVGPDGANNVNILGGTGIDVAGNPGTNTLTISQETAFDGTGTTVGATTVDLLTLSLGATPSCYTLEARVAAFDSSTPSGGGMWALGAFRTDGAAATEIATESENELLDAALAAAEVDWIASGNTAILRANGVAGLTINWSAEGEYVQAV